MTMASSIKLKRVFFYLYWIIFSLDHFEKIISYTQKYLKRKFFHRIKKHSFYIYRKKKNNNQQYFFIDNKKKSVQTWNKFRNDCQFKKKFNNRSSVRFEPVRTSSKRFVPTSVSNFSDFSPLQRGKFLFFPS